MSRRWNFSASMISGSQNVEHVVALFHDGHLGAQCREHGGVLDADHAGAHHHHRCRQRLQVENPVGVQDAVFVELDTRRASGLGARGDHDVFAAEGGAFAAGGLFDQHGVRVDEAPVALNEVDAIAHELRPHDVLLLADHMRGAGEQVGGGDLLLHAVTRAVELPLVYAGEVDDGLPQRLRRDGSGVHANSAEHPATFDDRHRLAELCRGYRGLLAARTRTDDDEVVLEHGTHGNKVYAGCADLARRQASTAPEISRPCCDSGPVRAPDRPPARPMRR